MIDPYLAGVLFGDGCRYIAANGAHSVWIDQTERNRGVLEYEVVPRLTRMGFKVFYYRYFARKDNVFKWRALVYSKDFYEEITAITSDVTNYFHALRDEDALNFIAGLYDAEGTYTDRVVIYNSNRILLEAIKTRLERMGLRGLHIYRFGTIYGLQLYRRHELQKFLQMIPARRLECVLSG